MYLHLQDWGDGEAPPLVALHGVTAHGLRFRRLAEEEWARSFHVLAPDLRGHGRSDWEPPWSLRRLALDVLEIVGTGPATWVGHSLGGRLVLEVAAVEPAAVARVVLLDPALQLLPNVALNLAEQECRDQSFGSVEEAIAVRAESAVRAPREFLEEEMAQHLVASPDGRLRYRYSHAAAASVYGELASTPPGPPIVPTLLVLAQDFGLVREEQLIAYRRALGRLLEVVEVEGGHTVYWDAYPRTARAVREFLG